MTRQQHRGVYPDDWPTIAANVKAEANYRCVRCDHPHAPELGRTLTVHHLDVDKSNCRWWNLVALCQACHLSIQGRVILDRPWLLPHSAWFEPYAAGWYAWKYLGEDLTREQVTARLDELLRLERAAALGLAGAVSSVGVYSIVNDTNDPFSAIPLDILAGGMAEGGEQ